MDSSVFGTGSLILNKAMSALKVKGAGANTVPGYSNGGFVTQNGLGRVDAMNRFLQLNWSLPAGSPADFPMVLNYHSNANLTTVLGTNWSSLYQRSADMIAGPSGVTVGNPQGDVLY